MSVWSSSSSSSYYSASSTITVAGPEPRVTRSWSSNIINALTDAGQADEIPDDLIVGPLPPPSRRRRTINQPPSAVLRSLPPGSVAYLDSAGQWLAATPEALAEMKAAAAAAAKKKRDVRRGKGRRNWTWMNGPKKGSKGKGKGADNGDGGRFWVTVGVGRGRFCKRWGGVAEKKPLVGARELRGLKMWFGARWRFFVGLICSFCGLWWSFCCLSCCCGLLLLWFLVLNQTSSSSFF